MQPKDVVTAREGGEVVVLPAGALFFYGPLPQTISYSIF